MCKNAKKRNYIELVMEEARSGNDFGRVSMGMEIRSIVWVRIGGTWKPGTQREVIAKYPEVKERKKTSSPDGIRLPREGKWKLGVIMNGKSAPCVCLEQYRDGGGVTGPIDRNR